MIKALAALLLAYGGLVALVYLFQRSLQYYPDPRLGPPADHGVPEMAVVRLHTSDNLSLKSWYAPAPQGRPTVVYFHGNAGNISGRAHKARVLIDAGYGVLLVEYRGYGDNPGTPSEAGLYADAHAALDFLHAQGVTERELVLYGESLGSGVAVQIATERPPRAVILEAPYTTIADVAKRAYWFLPVEALLKDRFESIRKIAALHAPLLILHGELDATVPVDLGRRLFDAAPEPKHAVWFPEAGHTDLFEHGAGPTVVEWLTRP